jgi:putative PIN family toxin of toxin-antitoxin system
LLTWFLTVYVLSLFMRKIIVIDTNVFISALISSEGASRELLRQCLEGVYKPLMGAALYWEYEHLLQRKEVMERCSLAEFEIDELLDAFMSVCVWTPLYYLWRPNLKDENDNHVLELAVGGNANAVATHNKRDFMEGELLFPHIQILTPKELLVASKEE